MYVFNNILLNTYQNEKCARKEIVEKIKHIFMFNFFLNRAVYEITWKNMGQTDTTDDNMTHALCMIDN